MWTSVKPWLPTSCTAARPRPRASATNGCSSARTSAGTIGAFTAVAASSPCISWALSGILSDLEFLEWFELPSRVISPLPIETRFEMPRQDPRHLQARQKLPTKGCQCSVLFSGGQSGQPLLSTPHPGHKTAKDPAPHYKQCMPLIKGRWQPAELGK